MSSNKRIAIIGSRDPNREGDYAINKEKIQDAEKAGEDIGFALAEHGFGIDVYSSDDYMFEVDVVRGYAKFQNAKPNSIRVLFNSSQTPPSFAEELEHSQLFDPEPNPGNMENWEVSFYNSIADVDGVVLLGGGNSTLIAGLVALGHRKPVLPLGMFGGAARNVWEVLGISENYIPEGNLDKNDWDKMGFSNHWSPDLGKALVNSLKRQFDAQAQKAADAEAKTQQIIADAIEKVRIDFDNAEERGKKARLYTLLTIPLFVGIFVLWGFSQAVSTIAVSTMYTILIFSALAGGIVGSSMRVVFNRFLGNTTTAVPELLESIVVGLISGGIAAGMFLTAQTNALNTLSLTEAELAGQLKPLVFNVALIGIVGGVGIEAVWNNLKSADPLKPAQSFSSVQPNPNNPSRDGV